MPFPLIPLAISGISALGGYLANRKSQTKQTQDTSQTSNYTNETQPNYDPQMLQLRDYLWRSMMERSESPFESTGYQTGGIKSINDTADTGNRLLESLLSKYGISGSGMGRTAQMMGQLNRLNKTAEFQSQIPLLSDTWKKSNLQTLADFFTKLPVGSKTSGIQTSTGQNTNTQFNPGNPWAGALQGGSSMLGYLYGQGAFSPNSNSAPKSSPMPSNSDPWNFFAPRTTYGA